MSSNGGNRSSRVNKPNSNPKGKHGRQAQLHEKKRKGNWKRRK